MKLPRDLSGQDLGKALSRLGYRVTRQIGSHNRLSTEQPTPHHVTTPAHDPLKAGTLAAIFADVAARLKLDRDELLRRLFA